MDAVYLISLIVGGFFVLLSIFGGADSDADADADFDGDADFDADFDVDADVDTDMHFGGDVDVGAGVGFVDLFSVRALFLGAAFFGLTGTLLNLISFGEPFTAIIAAVMGIVIGLGGNYIIKSIGYRHVSSDVSARTLTGKTAKVLLPFEGAEQGKISVIANGQRLHLRAASLDGEVPITFDKDEEVVVVKMEGAVAKVVKPN